MSHAHDVVFLLISWKFREHLFFGDLNFKFLEPVSFGVSRFEEYEIPSKKEKMKSFRV